MGATSIHVQAVKPCLNLGFDNLYKASSAITEIFRAGELAGAKEAFEEVEKQYNITVNAIKAM